MMEKLASRTLQEIIRWEIIDCQIWEMCTFSWTRTDAISSKIYTRIDGVNGEKPGMENQWAQFWTVSVAYWGFTWWLLFGYINIYKTVWWMYIDCLVQMISFSLINQLRKPNNSHFWGITTLLLSGIHYY